MKMEQPSSRAFPLNNPRDLIVLVYCRKKTGKMKKDQGCGCFFNRLKQKINLSDATVIYGLTLGRLN
jgi:cell division protein YceG involved in septum cleavage